MFLAAQLDERTKKILLVLCALFIIVLLIFGAIYVMISKYMQKPTKNMRNKYNLRGKKKYIILAKTIFFYIL